MCVSGNIPRETGVRHRSDVQLEPEVLASINRHHRRALALRGAAAVPLMGGVLCALGVLVYRAARGQEFPSPAFSASSAASWIPMVVIAAMSVLFVLLIRPEKMPVVSHPDSVSFQVFRNALDGVSVAVGLEAPELLVLDLPTANAITFIHAGKPAVAVTKEALEAGMPRRCAEAMMAHELSHVLMKEVILGSNRRRWLLIGLSLAAFLLLPFVLLALSFGFGVWLYVALLGWMALMIFAFNRLGPMLYRQNDLLSDSVAAKITGDPAALKDAILLVEGLFMRTGKPFAPGSRFPELLFVYEGPLSRTGVAGRVENLDAIERGHWLEFDATSGSGHFFTFRGAHSTTRENAKK